MTSDSVVREDLTCPEQALQYETLFTIGNGYAGVRGLFEEQEIHPHFDSTRVHGLFNFVEGDLSPDLAPAPHWLGLSLEVGGHRFGMDSGRVLGYERSLDPATATLTRRVLWESPAGDVVRLEFERFASSADQHVLALRVIGTVLKGAPKLRVLGGIETRVTLPSGFNHWKPWQTGSAAPDSVWVRSETTQSGYGLAMAAALISDLSVAPSTDVDSPHPLVRINASLVTGQQFTVTKLVTVYTSRDSADPHADAQAALDRARRMGYDALCEAHLAHWSRRWAESDVELDGDPFLQQAIRFGLYHVLIAAPQHDDDVSIGAKTLSGAGYRGHVFWDTELFMVPPLTLTQPHLARNLLMYRYHRLAGARAKARENGYQGAMFPWESADTGSEVTPKWSHPDAEGKRIRIWTGELEQHLTSDIAYAIMQYWRWTGDDAFLKDYGAEIVLDGARFWASRAEWNAAAGRYEMNHVIGPDEYHEDVNNSVFTNRMARWHLETAQQVWRWLDERHPTKAEALAVALDLDDTAFSHWQDVIDHLTIPFDEERQVYIQFDNFFDLAPVDVLAFEPRVASLQSVFGHEPTQKLQIIKQADVVMMIALLGEQLGDKAALRRNWDTYYPMCDQGSSLSPAAHAWVAARLGLVDLARDLFEHAASIDLRDNKGNARDGIHGAACGGLWQAIAFGFAGLHLTDDGPALDPHLPPGWDRLRFSVRYHDERYTFTIEGGDVRIERS